MSADDIIGPFKTKKEAEKVADEQNDYGGRSVYVEKYDNEWYVEIRYAG